MNVTYEMLKEEIENLSTDEIIKLIYKIDLKAQTEGYIKGYKVGWDDNKPKKRLNLVHYSE